MADTNLTPAKSQQGKLKQILLLVFVIIFAIGLSVAGTLWFLQKDGEADEVADDSDSDVEVFVPSQYYVLDKALVASLMTQERQRYAQVHLAVEAGDPAALAAVEKHLPLIRSRLLSVIGRQDFATLQTPDGRNALVGSLSKTTNEVLAEEGEPEVRGVLLRNFVLQ